MNMKLKWTNKCTKQSTKQSTKHGILKQLLGFFFTIFMIPILLVTSAEALLYWTPDYFEYEYEKYHVLDNVPIEMEDLLFVTDEMMAYLKGKRENLHIETSIQGRRQEFFNQREIEHMKDVQKLFLLAISIRRWCILFDILIVIALLFLKADLVPLLPRSIWMGTLFLGVLTVGFSFLISRDFTHYFIRFHEIFFDNDLWLLNPETDLLINIVPEPFFMDTAYRIAILFIASLATLCFFSIMFHVKHHENESKKSFLMDSQVNA